MKKYIIALILLAFIVPTVALASWWNPFSWFNGWTFHKTEVAPSVQVETDDTQPTASSSKNEDKNNAPVVESVKPTNLIKQKTVSCNGQEVIDTCPSQGKKFVCVADKVGCYSEYEANNLFVCNGKAYLSCETKGQKSICPTVGEAYCDAGSSLNEAPQKSAAEIYLEELNKKEEARIQAEKDRKNSPACISATRELERIEKQIEPLEEKREKSWDNYLRTGKYDTSEEASSLSSKLADLSLRKSGLQDKYWAACENFYPTPRETTICNFVGNMVYCN